MSEQISVVLFGLTGQGKSSIANMLIQGDIRHKENKFVVNDDAIGASAQIKCNANDAFIVHDTIGVGETNCGSVPHKEAVKRIRNYFSECKMPLNYIAFVKKKGRFTEEDRKMFKIFKEIFEGGEKNFIIIITNSGPEWVKKYSKTIKENLGDHPIIPVDFPWSEDENFYESVIKRKKRIQSLLHLIDELFNLEYEGIELEVLDSVQAIPVVGRLISSIFFKK
ncbi:13637_t:CDS:1 [Funneliformis caledonium]|uniref:13637_t:CDS:1 n=1 Tax=Funneliformis caledonium TaxID=1117310 RepID=A0A9N9G6X8_9GLOM|nr:13637_t:CDS:1 [Funneliformis caledonium]